MSPEKQHVHNLSSLLDALADKINEDGIVDPGTHLSLDDVLDLVGRRAYGPILLIIGLLSISPLNIIPGATWALAALAALICGQMALRQEHPWLPRKVLKMHLSEDKLHGFISVMRPSARFIDKFLKPRLTFLSEPPWCVVIALCCMAAALITFPLGLFPFVPLIPACAIIFFGLGLTAKDGWMLTLGAGVMGAALWLALRNFI